MALRFTGKHVAVVGATGVIGSHVAQAFARQGAVVSLLGRSALTQRARLESQLAAPAAAAPAAAAATASTAPRAHQFLKLDVSDAASIKEVFGGRRGGGGPTAATAGAAGAAGAEAEAVVVGQVDVLVNCAGISQTTFLKRTPDEELERIVDTNLLATMLVCKHARMQPHGCIINVSSLMATHGGFGATAYAASKAGLIGFTRALCRELAPRSIRVNALLPGWVDSDMWQNLKPELQQAYLKDTPLGRVADPAEVADAAVFLAANQFANNCILNLDGGLSAA
ncbi:3-ketoacyl-(acyl-carrier-protein) reductase [Cordyceps javanica]|uniref:3-ketoacyl-(Acyl-carrier-protein) reductase n=1 Tax=Cordyceps javanica TaxID=43265 RepID=A0A545UZY5_9HYPO|nr:3-ketoacyl-(acyl-carrier-protein) reductase [Cordyceps javanica]TQW05750.1 3-ketoacyl-(acyl-carrier-protein) reductase [Cordyceps javanica]